MLGLNRGAVHACTYLKGEGMAEKPKTDAFEAHYQKSNYFRVVHVDGAFGGPSARGLVNIAFFSERNPLPRRTMKPLVGGAPGIEEIVEVKQGVIRELEVNVVMDIAVAAAVQKWLGGVILNTQEQLGLTKEAMDKFSGVAGE